MLQIAAWDNLGQFLTSIWLAWVCLWIPSLPLPPGPVMLILDDSQDLIASGEPQYREFGMCISFKTKTWSCTWAVFSYPYHQNWLLLDVWTRWPVFSQLIFMTRICKIFMASTNAWQCELLPEAQDDLCKSRTDLEVFSFSR